MPFTHIAAQEPAVATLGRALASGRVHHAYRFEGPDGVGKELAAFALAQALVCTGGVPTGCGLCDACRRAGTLATERPETPLHPDVVVLERGLYPAEIIGRSRGETSELSVDQVRSLVLARIAFPPHEGRARVFIIRRADELSIGAANALLKTLEEPPRRTHFVLLTSRGERLLDTIRSRTLPIRFGPLPPAVLDTILAARGVAEDRRALAIELAQGSASAALELADPELSAARDAFVAAAMRAIAARDLGPALTLAESRDRDKDSLRADLLALAASLAKSARAAIESDPTSAARDARRYRSTLQTLASLDRNASPSLAFTALFAELRDA